MSQQSDCNLLFGEALRQQILIGILQLLDYLLATHQRLAGRRE